MKFVWSCGSAKAAFAIVGGCIYVFSTVGGCIYVFATVWGCIYVFATVGGCIYVFATVGGCIYGTVAGCCVTVIRCGHSSQWAVKILLIVLSRYHIM